MIRLQKVIAASGLASRRTAETMIRNGEVTVNGTVVRVLGTCVDPLMDHVKVNGRHVRQAEPEVFVLLHKPAGYVTTMSDPHGRPTIADLLAGVKVRVVPVGRLDYDAEGLLLLTNNGTVAQACLHPRYHVPKTYLVKVSGLCTDEELQTLQDGVALDDGMTAPAVVKKSGKARINSWLELTIHEGKKHQVKRMIEALGHRVVRIKRTRFGPLMLGMLRTGTCRFATDAEANALRALLQESARPRIIRPAVSARPMRPRKPARPERPQRPALSAHLRKPALPARPQRPALPAYLRKPALPAYPRKPALPVRPQKPALARAPAETREARVPAETCVAHALAEIREAHAHAARPAHLRKPALPAHLRKPHCPCACRNLRGPRTRRNLRGPRTCGNLRCPCACRNSRGPRTRRNPGGPRTCRNLRGPRTCRNLRCPRTCGNLRLPTHTQKPGRPAHLRKPALPRASAETREAHAPAA